MRNAKSVHFWQVDHEVRNIFEVKGTVILSSPQAWQRFKWTKKFFEEKPKEGFFIWIKEQVNFPLATCFTIASPKIFQDLRNLLVIEKNLKIKLSGVCHTQKNNLAGRHLAKGKLILKEGSALEYNHFHYWGEKDFVLPDYQFILGKETSLIYNYRNLFPPENLQLVTTIFSGENSSSNLNLVINGKNTKVNLKETIFLEGKNSQGIVRLRLVGRKKTEIEAISKIFAKAPGKGHLDCQGLLIDKTAKISLIPQLICQNKEAQITHEASIGKTSEEELTYLRMKGLTEKEAIDLIVSGFLKI